MPIDVTTEVEIRRPRAEVAAYASDLDNATAWYTNIEAVEWATPRPARVGSRIEFVARFLGRRLVYVYEVREIVPDERFVMATAHGAFPMETTYAWGDAANGATRMQLRNRGEPPGFSRLLAPIMAAAVRRANRKDLRRLKRILEGGWEDRERSARGSVRELQCRFREASEPELEALVGRHKATFAGWLRLGGPLAMRVTGMPGWWGKQFRVSGGGEPLEGENLLRRGGRLVESIPMAAEIAPSRVDGRPTILIRYPPDARWPHNRVNDELRPLDEGTLLGLSFGLPLAPSGGAPFILHREDEAR